ncbi:MAG: glycoside hydrolase family 65 protein [Spirochaetaceae bacterium]|nr:glycoside hydrolase family 65 protein [Spirochaetaceae bacterium]
MRKESMDPKWIIEQTNFDDRSQVECYESLFTLGNGYLGLRGDLPLHGKAIRRGTYINGFYEKGPITYGEKAYGFADNWQTIVPLPEGKEVNFTVNGVELFHNKGRFIQNKRILNMKDSYSLWQFSWVDESGRVYEGTVRTIVPFHFKGTAVFIWDIALPDNESSIEISSPLLFDSQGGEDTDDPRLPAHFNSKSITLDRKCSDQGDEQLILKTGGSRLVLSCAMDHIITGLESLETVLGSQENGFIRTYTGKAAKSIGIVKVLSYSYGNLADEKKVEKSVGEEMRFAREKGVEGILADQRDFMDQFWSTGDVQIEGDEEAQISLRFNLFQMLQSTGRDGERSIAAKGLSGPGYEGHYFWDAETYVLPFFIYTNPHIARSMLKYRISILDKAKERAALLGHEGALFPWRTINGEESSAYFPAGTAQYHINADIALGLNKYLEVTGDLSILDEGGSDLLAETSRFWCSLGCHIEGKGFCFNSVTGPDEYTALVDNNYYTNLLARENLKAAVHWLNESVSQQEINLWRETAGRIFLPDNCEVTPQDDSFLQKEKWDFDNTPKSKYPLLLNFHPLNIYRKQVLKQADVVMAQALYRSHFPPGLLRRNFHYYEELTTRDSSLSSCAQGINAHWLGYEDLAWEYFLETVHTDRKDLHHNVSHGLHTASMGGSYLMILNGFLGLENQGGTVRFRPRLSDKLKGIILHISIGKSLVKVNLKGNTVEYTAVDSDVFFYHYSKRIDLKIGQSLTIDSHPELKHRITDIEGKSLLDLEKSIFNQISEMKVLPEETIICTDFNSKEKFREFLGYSYAHTDENTMTAFQAGLQKKEIYRGKRLKILSNEKS